MFTFLQSSLFQIGVSNAVLATGLALIVFLVTWKSKWPAWSHALWVLVLVKLVAPPIYWVSAELPANASLTTALATSVLTGASNVAVLDEQQSAIQVSVLDVNVSPTNMLPTEESVVPHQFTYPNRFSTFWLTLVWLVGATGFFGVTVYRYLKFKRWLRTAKSAPADLVDLVSSVADEIGLGRVPTVHLVRRVIAPSVYSLGRRAYLLMPVGLSEQLTESELRSVVAHELTHLRRGDHWVRMLEIVAGSLFWWHPVVPFVRRKIHAAADESCDARVVSQNPGAARDYASAMLKTVDFLSGTNSNHTRENAVMPLMIAIGDSRSLMRRMRQISGSAASPSVSTRGRFALAAAAMLLLPLGMLTLAPTTDAGQPPVQESTASDEKNAQNNDPIEDQSEPVGEPSRGWEKFNSRTRNFFNESDDPFGDSDPFASGGSNSAADTSRRIDPVASENMPTAKTAKATIAGEATRESSAERKQAVEERLRAALRSEISMTFPDIRLREALRVLSASIDVPIIVDRVALESVGLTTDTPISLSLTNVSMRSFLQLMLRDLELTYMIKDEVILITTNDVAEKNPTLKTYTLPAELSERSEKILAALTSNVKPDIWKEAGGLSTASVIDNVLIVSTTEAAHDEVETFLGKIESAFKVYQQKQKAVAPGQ